MVSRSARQSTKARAATLCQEATDLFILSKIDSGDSQTLRRALMKARRALILDPSNYDALTLMGSIYAELEDEPDSVQKAFEYYDRALRLEPKNPHAFGSKAALLLYVLDRPSEAQPLAETAVALSVQKRDPPDVLELNYITLVDALIARRRFAQARASIREALRRCRTTLMAESSKVWFKEIADQGGNATNVKKRRENCSNKAKRR
jgi:tetratricopeptide (TPR) repeat protein